MLQVDRLSIHFADREEVQEVVRGISFSVQDGEIVGIVGESGSGKTMTALTIAGLFKEHAVLDAGTIRLDGTDLLKLTQPPDASLGRMLSEAQTYLSGAPWCAVFPGMFLVLLVLGVGLLGEGILDRFGGGR